MLLSLNDLFILIGTLCMCFVGSAFMVRPLHCKTLHCKPSIVHLHAMPWQNHQFLYRAALLQGICHGTSHLHHKSRHHHTKLCQTSLKKATLPPDCTQDVLNISTNLPDGVSDQAQQHLHQQAMYRRPSHNRSQTNHYNNSTTPLIHRDISNTLQATGRTEKAV